MSLRALGSILTRSGTAARRGARSRSHLHTLKDIAGGGDSSTVGIFAVGGSALAGLVGMLYFREHDDQSAGEITDRRRKEKEMKEEAAMKARFEDWMKQYGRTYISDKEKDRRYQIFKARAEDADRRNAARNKPDGAHYTTDNTADWTDHERSCMKGQCGDFSWYNCEYIDAIIALKDKEIRIRGMSDKEKAGVTNSQAGRNEKNESS